MSLLHRVCPSHHSCLLLLYIHVTVPPNRFIFKQPTRRTNYPNLYCYKTLHVSGILSPHHQEFSTAHSALVSSMKVFDDRFQAEPGWNIRSSLLYIRYWQVSCRNCGSILTLLGNGHKNLHKTYQCRMYSRELLMMGREDTRNM